MKTKKMNFHTASSFLLNSTRDGSTASYSTRRGISDGTVPSLPASHKGLDEIPLPVDVASAGQRLKLIADSLATSHAADFKRDHRPCQLSSLEHARLRRTAFPKKS